MRLPNQTKADRQMLAQFGEADKAAVQSFVTNLRRGGSTLVRKRVVTVSATIARQLWAAGEKGSAFTFDRRALRYLRGAEMVAPETVKAAAEAALSEARFKIHDAALRLQQGRLDVADWLDEHNRHVKVLHGAENVLARGGFREMTSADWESAGNGVARDYGYSRAFAEDVASGRYGIAGENMGDAVLQRAGLYADNGRAVFENAQVANAKDRLGHDRARRILGAVDHCDGCVEAAEAGWVDIEDVLPIGEAQCLGRCNCVIITSAAGNEID